MVKGRGLLFLLATVLVVVGYAIFDVQSEKKDVEKKEAESKVIQYSPDQVNEILIDGTHKISLKRDKDGWRLEEPLTELAEQTAVEDFVKGLALEKYTQVIKQGPDIAWADYGLDAPKGKISLRTNSGQTMEIQISSTKNFQGDAYLRLSGDDRVLLASSTWYIKLDKKAFDFRDKRLFQGGASDVSRFVVKTGKNSFSIQKKDDKWELADSPSIKLDQNKVREFISSLNSTQATDIVDKGTVKLGAPLLVINFGLGDGKSWTGNLASTSKGERYFWSNDSKYLFKLNTVDGENLLKVSVNELRDRREPFLFAKTDVKKMELITGVKKTELELKEDKWSLVQAQPDFEVDQVKSKSLITKLEGLQVAEFLGAQAKLKAGTGQEVVLRKQDGSLLFSMLLGDKMKDKDKVLYFAKTNLFPEVFTVSEESVNNLNLGEVVTKKKSVENNPIIPGVETK